MRTENSIKNAVVAFVSNFVLIIVGFISQAIFKNCLGQDYLGLNGLFTSIVSMLSIVELGLGTALIYHLYKPVAENDIETIKTLMHFYRVSYRVIAAIIIVAGALLMPFLHLFVKIDVTVNIHYIFALFVVESAFSYLLSYKRSIIYAHQENYIVNAVHIGYVIGLNACQIFFLIKTSDYILYLWIKIAFRILENIVVTIIANKKYPYIRQNNIAPMDTIIRDDIVKKVKGLFLHRIGSYLVLGTDNIIISRFLNIGVVGIYSSYSMITSGIKNLFAQVYYSITASVGNLLVLDKERAYEVYKEMLFANYWLSCFCSISFYIISKPFVVLWLGNEFVLPEMTTFVIMLNLYFDTYGYTIGAFKSAAGIFHEDRWIPMIQSVINIITSIILAKVCGLTGVVIGTILSQMLMFFFSYPQFVYKKLFDRSYFFYCKETISYFIVFLLVFVVTVIISSFIYINSHLLSLLVNAVICIMIPNTFLFVLFRKSNEFKFMYNTVMSKIVGKMQRVK